MSYLRLLSSINATLVIMVQVDDKYQYSMDNKDGGVHGWISSSPVVGFWTIFPSQEFRNGGPTKQNLTVHTGPTCLAVIITNFHHKLLKTRKEMKAAIIILKRFHFWIIRCFRELITLERIQWLISKQGRHGGRFLAPFLYTSILLQKYQTHTVYG